MGKSVSQEGKVKHFYSAQYININLKRGSDVIRFSLRDN